MLSAKSHPILAVILVMVSWLVASLAWPQDFRDLNTNRDIAQVARVFHGDRLAGVGTAVVIHRDGWLITANHVARLDHDEDRLKIGLHDARVVERFEKLDTALLYVDHKFPQSAWPRTQASWIGMPVAGIAHSHGQLRRRWFFGHISDIWVSTFPQHEGGRIWADMTTPLGISGGPLFDVGGALVGIGSYKHVDRSFASVGVFVPVMLIYDKTARYWEHQV